MATLVSSALLLFTLFGQAQPPQVEQMPPGGAGQKKGALPPELVLEGGATVQANQIVFNGNEKISSEQLQKLVYPFLNRPLAQSDISEIRNRVGLLYQIKGFEGTKVIVSGSPRSTTLMVTIMEGTQEE